MLGTILRAEIFLVQSEFAVIVGMVLICCSVFKVAYLTFKYVWAKLEERYDDSVSRI